MRDAIDHDNAPRDNRDIYVVWDTNVNSFFADQVGYCRAVPARVADQLTTSRTETKINRAISRKKPIA